MELQPASKFQALAIARLIMMAMTDDCCRYFTGPDYTLEDFEMAMTELVLSDNTQYSYLNTIVAIDDEGGLCGACVSYDGARLHELRKAFTDAMTENFGRDFTDMKDETAEGELYIDSLAVPEAFRRQGIASKLLGAVIEKAERMGLPAVGLLVDKENPKAERLYRKIGFKKVGESSFGGHPMKHLQYKIDKEHTHYAEK